MVFQTKLLPWIHRRNRKDGGGGKSNNDGGEQEEHDPQKLILSTPTEVKEVPSSSPPASQSADIVVAGGGIVGLVLALALKKYCHILVDIYEQADAFHDDVGAGMGMYPNGLRVIRDISPNLLMEIRNAGYEYQFRRWMRHDGTEIAVADETVLARDPTNTTSVPDIDLQPIGIRRWRLQKILFEAAVEEGIQIHFGKRLESIKELTDDTIHMRFEDGSTKVTKLLLAADGAKSKIRSIVTQGKCTLKYTGTTCLMGTASTHRPVGGGLALPSSPTTRCHGAFYPTGPSEQCFQFHFPVSLDNIQPQSMGGWGGMTHLMSSDECEDLAKQLEDEGWDKEQFLRPLQNVEKALKIGLTTLDPPLRKFTFHRVILVGDAAHPPVPYLGQGAQQGLEDAGTLALLLKRFCVIPRADDNDETTTALSFDRLKDASRLYNELRVPRTTEMVERGKLAGVQQQKRAENRKYNRTREELIKREVFYNENSSHLFPGVRHDYKEAVQESIHAFEVQEKQEDEANQQQLPHHLLSVPEEE